MKFSTWQFSTGFCALILALSLSATTAAQDAEGTITERQDNFKTIGKSFKAIRDQVRSGQPDMAAVQEAADTIAVLTEELHTWFPQGTGPATGIETEAKMEIWQQPDEFKAATDKLIKESSAFAQLAAEEDASQLGRGMMALGGACKNCHDQFREED